MPIVRSRTMLLVPDGISGSHGGGRRGSPSHGNVGVRIGVAVTVLGHVHHHSWKSSGVGVYLVRVIGSVVHGNVSRTSLE